MAYPIIPNFLKSDEETNNITNLLTDISQRKEFYTFKPTNYLFNKNLISGFTKSIDFNKKLIVPGLKLNNAQLFIRNFQNPNTEFTRVLINWQTGTGKSIAAISIGNEFIRQYRLRTTLGEKTSTVFIISFTAQETIKQDMLKYPEFGFVSYADIEELKRLYAVTAISGSNSPEGKTLSNLLGSFRRRITDKTRGGNYQFYGYKEFANRLFIITQKGLLQKLDIQNLFSHDTESEDLLETIDKAIGNGNVIINEDLLESLKNGLLIADEIHNVYNILEKNNYGIAIQYVLDKLGDEAPRAVFMSATPMTGSAAEIIDLLNLLIPKSYLSNSLKRSDFFIKGKIGRPELSATQWESKFVLNSKLSITLKDLSEKDDYDIDVSSFSISQLKPDALDKIAKLSAGRVSFLLDSDIESYPKRIFVGESVKEIPYLKFTLCPMSPLHEITLKHEHTNLEFRTIAKSDNAGLASNAYTLYDIVFPNPEFKSIIGLYKSIETPLILLKTAEEWRLENGINIENGIDFGLNTNSLLISGTFLYEKNIAKYSTKYHKLLLAVLNTIKSGPGKIMIYHHRVRMSGVLLIQELLRMNGFIDNMSESTDSTICAICGVKRSEHQLQQGVNRSKHQLQQETLGVKEVEPLLHTFIPAKFIVAHSDIDRLTMMRNINHFNSISNLEGYQYRVIIGSKIIREGLNFKAIRYQFIMSLPTDFPTLMQVFGRTVRKDSHIDLPEDQKDVKIQIFVSTRADGTISPELQRYIDKGKEYIVIQEVEKVLRINAVDGFANYSKILKVIKSNDGVIQPSIDSLPYKPISIVALNKELNISELKLSTFNAFHSEREVYIITNICRVLFQARPVWKYNDLWEAIQSGIVKGINYNYKLFDEGNFAIAIHLLKRPSGDPLKHIIQVNEYFILTNLNSQNYASKTLNLDIESYLRSSNFEKPIVNVKISDYLKSKKTEFAFTIYFKYFIENYLVSESDSNNLSSNFSKIKPIELSLIDFNSIFHYTLIKKIIEFINEDEKLLSELKITKKQKNQIFDLYKRFKIIITLKNLNIQNTQYKSIIGYITPNIISVYDKQWFNISYSDAKFNINTKENDIVIGFVTDDGINTKFKTRLPLHKIKISTDKKYDIRSLAKGAVCETRVREDLNEYVIKLKSCLTKIGIFKEYKLKSNIKLTSDEITSDEITSDEINSDEINSDEITSDEITKKRVHYAIKYDQSEKKKYLPSSILCNTIKLYLLALEEYSKNNTNIKWIYLFNDKLPSIQLTDF